MNTVQTGLRSRKTINFPAKFLVPPVSHTVLLLSKTKYIFFF